MHAARTHGKPLAGVRLPRRAAFDNRGVSVDYSGPLDAWLQLRQELRQWRRGGRPLREIVAELDAARDGVRRQILRSELSTPSALRAPGRHVQNGMTKKGTAVANILKLLPPDASDLTSHLQRRRLVTCGECGTSGCDRREAAREWSGALPSMAVSASALGEAGGDVTRALRTLLGEREEVLAGCTECFSMQELEAGSRQAGTARAVVYGQHLRGTAAWQHSGDAPELLLAELPELEQGWEAWVAGGWALEEEMELDLPLVGGAVLPVCYGLAAVIQYDGGHYACDARDPSDDRWYYACTVHAHAHAHAWHMHNDVHMHMHMSHVHVRVGVHMHMQIPTAHTRYHPHVYVWQVPVRCAARRTDADAGCAHRRAPRPRPGSGAGSDAESRGPVLARARCVGGGAAGRTALSTATGRFAELGFGSPVKRCPPMHIDTPCASIILVRIKLVFRRILPSHPTRVILVSNSGVITGERPFAS